ncbi:MAG TPA: 4-hydroxythreonine-4-phosphate dehydrogenase PdxA [Mobilitalea sp.]|nr:4-hydroxythreonine-4-phosphate dehydrogenase PdxA [Mobilitalea sp.]
MDKRPVIGITMGDPAGIGPEITVKALSNPEIYEKCVPIIIGDSEVLKKAIEVTGHIELTLYPINTVKQAQSTFGRINVLDMKLVDMERLKTGAVSVMAGEAAFQYVKKVIELALNQEVDATVTNAINKEAINLAGHHYSGHTEIYADLTGTSKYTMMLAYRNLRVVHISTHLSLREACDRVKKERILEVIEIAHKACTDMGITEPVIGVAGLNPHCGENGLFGTEEIKEITPAIEAARAKGINVQGPVPPDSIFSKAIGGWYDIVVAMYHDQGHIPLKVKGFVYNQDRKQWDAVEGVNITLGLPIIRTSVDHGTAYDQAWTGMANERSLVNAIDYAVSLAGGKITGLPDHNK